MSNKIEKVVVVTVTFNDVDFLLREIRFLKKQTYKIYRIVIVDNNSNEQCKEKLRNIKNDDNIDIIWLDNNIGGAGGFQKGMEYAYKKYNSDWYWLMDADAYPQEDCLEKLLEYKDLTNNIGYLAPLIMGDDLKKYQLYHHKRLSAFLEKDLYIYNESDEIQDTTPIEADAFVGPLISRKAVAELGFPKGELFIYGDDLEYTYRISRKFNSYLIKSAVINHRDQPSNAGVQKPVNWWKDYYMYRNRIFFIKEFQNNKFKKYIGYILVRLRCTKQVLLAYRLKYNKKLINFRIATIRRAYKDGLNNKSGKIIDPIAYKNKVNELIK